MTQQSNPSAPVDASVNDDQSLSPVDSAVASDTLRVFFDGSCPLCRSEIAFLKARDRDQKLDCVDISDQSPGAEVAPGLRQSDAMARMHVAHPDGRLASGANAFLAMWSRIPMLRPFTHVFSIPPLPWVMERAYRGFLRIRPRMQAWAKRREARS